MVEPVDAAEGAGLDVPGHAVIAEIGQRVAQRGQLPVEHGDHARLGLVEDEVVEAEVAVHDADLRFVAGAGRNVLRQPFDQPVHFLDRLGDRRQVLLAPAADLALEIVARLAVVGQPHGIHVHAVQGGDDAVHLVVESAAPGRRHAGQRLVPEHAAVHEFHDVEGAADDGLVGAQQVHLRHRHAAAGECLHDAELAVHRVRRRQQFCRWPGLAAHDIGAPGREQLVGGVGLAALELFHDQRAAKARQFAFQVRLQCGGVEGVARGHGLGAGVVFHSGGLHLSAIASNFSRESTTSRVGSTRTAPSRSKPFSSWLTRWREAPSSCARSSCASARPMRISSPRWMP